MQNFLRFPDLPQSLQDAIWGLSLRDVLIRRHPKKPLDLGKALAIASVSRSARECVFRVGVGRLAKLRICARGDTHYDIFLPDLDKHTLTISAYAFYQYPGIMEPRRLFQTFKQLSYTVGVLSNARHLIIHDERSEILYRSMCEHIAEGNGEHLKAEDGLPLQLRDPIDIITNELGSLSGDFANLRNITYIGKLADWSWWMGDEYRFYGPEVVSRPPKNIRPTKEPDSIKPRTEYENMVRYFEKRGISDDTGIEWENFGSTTDPREQWDNRRFWKDIPAELRVNPKIGLRGFSYNSSSCGGVWAGFRLYLGEHPRLEFSPLHWEDVKQYMYSFRTTSSGNPLPAIAHGYVSESVVAHFPQCIVKVDIIRPGELPPWPSPHHCWEPVDGAFDSSTGDPRGVDWRDPVDFSVPHPSWDPEEYMDPEFEGVLSAEQQKELKHFNRHRILTLFNLVVMHKLHKLGLPSSSFYKRKNE